MREPLAHWRHVPAPVSGLPSTRPGMSEWNLREVSPVVSQSIQIEKGGCWSIHHDHSGQYHLGLLPRVLPASVHHLVTGGPR